MKKTNKLLLVGSWLCFLVLGSALFLYRPFPRLVCWNVIESSDSNDFYWPPDNAPEDRHFETSNTQLSSFYEMAEPLIEGANDTVSKACAIAEGIRHLGMVDGTSSSPIRWGDPDSLLHQIKKGATGANCLHYSIIFAASMASIDIPVRLWVLEGDDGLKRFGHVVAEIYVHDQFPPSWVMIDVTAGGYFSDEKGPLSVLALRENLLSEKKNALYFFGKSSRKELIPENARHYYYRLMKMVFLRTANDFVSGFTPQRRYGIAAPLSIYWNGLPSNVQKALEWCLGRRDYLMYYVDQYVLSMRYKIYGARVLAILLLLNGCYCVCATGKIAVRRLLRSPYR